MRARRGAGATIPRFGLLALAGAIATLLLLPPFASAEVDFCPKGEGAGQCNGAQGLATDFETGRLYVADEDNHRIDVFDSASQEFLFAFGWGVDTGAAKFEKCTTASGCQAGIEGSGAGQFSRPRRVAVDNVAGSPTRHQVYAAGFESRWNRFEPDGTFLGATGWGVDTGAAALQTCTTASTCQAGIEGKGECQPGTGSSPVAIGPGGNVFVASAFAESARVLKFSPTGACLGQTTLLTGAFGLRTLAVDAAEDVFVSIPGAGVALRKYDLASPESILCELDPDLATNTVGTNAAGNLLARQTEGRAKGSGSFEVVTEYETSCPTKVVRRFGYGKIENFGQGVAGFASAAGDVLASGGPSNAIGVNYFHAPPPGPVISPPSLQASPVRSVWAGLTAEVNPEGKATTYRIDYVDQGSFETEGGFASSNTRSTGEVSLGASDFRLHMAETTAGCKPFSETALEEGKCLKPETSYRYRIVAENEDGENELEGQLTTRPPLEIEDLFSTSVSEDSATLHVRLNPLGSQATGRFEYVDEASYQESGFANAIEVPDSGESPIDFGSGEAPIAKAALASDLEPATTYRYRFLATDPFATLTSETKAFRTFPAAASGPCPNDAFRTGAAALLPDCRAYEMVSPINKAGGDIFVMLVGVPQVPAVLNQAAVSGERLAYGSYRAFGDAPSSAYTTQYIADRGPTGWESHAITPPRGRTIGESIAAEFESEFRIFSEDLCEGVVRPLGEMLPAVEGEVPGYYNLYRRTDRLCEPEAFEAISTAKPENRPGSGLPAYFLEPQGVSEDGSVTVFRGTDNLEGSGAPPQPAGCSAPNFLGCVIRLYIKGPGAPPRYACILPSGEPTAVACSAGVSSFSINGRTGNMTGALAADASALWWTESANGSVGRIYLRRNPLEPESARALGEATGSGEVAGATIATGNLGKTLTSVKKVVPSAGGKFIVGQGISAEEGIPAGTTITKIEEPEPGSFTLTLSKAATATVGGAKLSGAASEVVTGVKTEAGAFAAGQEISGAGGAFAEGTTIVKAEAEKPGFSKLTLSSKALKGGSGLGLRSWSVCSETDKACTVDVSKVAEIAEGKGEGRFWGAAPDGSKAIFAVGGVASSALYEFDAGSEATHKIAGQVAGVLGASENLDRIYFASREAIAGSGQNGEEEEAEDDEPNLYLYEDGAGYRFLATLAEADVNAGPADGSSATAIQPYQHNAHVSPDGLHLAFMSAASLTGYDNTDAESGKADTEVFLYDASANGGAGQLSCASCNPSGARPAGADVSEGATPFWIAARLTPGETNLYTPKALAEDGSRLFFESQDTLTPRDTNERIDVYEWETPGAGSCEEADPSFSALNDGCVYLISSGKSEEDSTFVDASPDGEDVFFTTLESFWPEDFGLLDIYDARAGGGYPPPPPPPAECEGEACQQSSAPAPFQAPATGTVGPGNPPPTTTAKCSKGKRRVVSKAGKQRCVKPKKKKRAHKKAKAGNNRARGAEQGRAGR